MTKNRDKRISVKVSEDEKTKLTQIAEEDGLYLSTYIRRIVTEPIRKKEV